jgi:paired amphipathic helix protein Sin3a
VLNDEWASHPTWASEDSGFVAHRKTAFEESLHRIEEERHDYDFNTEANVRVIHLLEPIAQKIASMTDEERANFTLRPDIAGQSSAIYQRVIKKLYGRDRGKIIIDNLYTHPCAVVPVLLNRLKLKTEEWKAIQVWLVDVQSY